MHAQDNDDPRGRLDRSRRSSHASTANGGRGSTSSIPWQLLARGSQLPTWSYARLSDHLRRARPLRSCPAGTRGRRVRDAVADPGAGRPAAPRGARRHRPGADRLGQDRRVRAPDDRVRRSGARRHPGARAHADPRAVHPGHAGAAHVRRRARASTSSPCSAARRSAPSRPSCSAGGQVVVGTVGRVLDLISRHSLVLNECRYVVLDEADEMLDLGFLEDVERILALTPNSRQTALFSATMPPPIRKLADRYLYDPVLVKVQSGHADGRLRRAVPGRREGAGQAGEARRGAARRAPDQAIVFVRTKIRCEQLYRRLRDGGHERQGAARRHVAGRARRRDALLQGRARADPRRDRRRGPRPGHLDRHARRQLRRPDLARRLRAPHRPHRPRRALGPRDHVRRAAPDEGARRRSRSTSRRASPGGSRARRSRPPRCRTAPRRHSKPRVSGRNGGARRPARRRRRPRRRPAGRRRRPRGHRPRPRSTARPCAT